MQWLILITSFLGKCDFINYHKCAMFANTVPWEQGAVDDKCGERPIADEICWAGGSRCAHRQGVHRGKGCGLLAVWDRPFRSALGTDACSGTEQEGAQDLCQWSPALPRSVLCCCTPAAGTPKGSLGPQSSSQRCCFLEGGTLGPPVLSSTPQQRRSPLQWWCPVLCPAVLDGNGEPLGSSVEWGAPAAGGSCPMLGWWKVLGTAELRDPWNICTGDGVFSQSQGMPPAHAWWSTWRHISAHWANQLMGAFFLAF